MAFISSWVNEYSTKRRLTTQKDVVDLGRSTENTKEKAQSMETNSDIIDGQVQVIEPTALESITKAEVDIQIATAHRYPRSLEQFKKRALAMVTQDQETAESCIYKLTRKDRKTGEVKVIEGESIRMAEIVASAYGNMRVAAQITSQTPARVTVRAIAHDLEANLLVAQEKQLKTTYRDGSPYSDDMAVTATNALISKAIRDAIFRVVPKAMVKSIKEAAKLVAVGTVATLEQRRSKAMEWVRSLKIDPVRVFAVLGVKGEADIGIDHLEVLTGLRTAIKEGDQTVDDAFPTIEPVASFGQAAHTPADESAQASAGLAPEQPQPKRGRPAGSKNKPKVAEPAPATPAPELKGAAEPTPPNQEPASTPEQPPTAPIQADETQVSPQGLVADFAVQNGVTWEDFRDWCATTHRLDDAMGYQGFEGLPSDWCKALLAEASALKRVAQIFGKRE